MLMSPHSVLNKTDNLTPLNVNNLPQEELKKATGIFTDVDDTLTTKGILHAQTLEAVQTLLKRGIRVVPVTGGSAGWCEHIARCWGVPAVIGEGGAFYFSLNQDTRQLLKCFWHTGEERSEKRSAMRSAREAVLSEFPGVVLASDQNYREVDLAIDRRNDRGALLAEDVQQEIARVLRRRGMIVKISSVHINAYFGDYDKLSMAFRMVRELWGEDLSVTRNQWLFVGDSQNDASMFAFFPYSIGVANVREALPELQKTQQQPRYITKRAGGEGFTDLAYSLLEAQQQGGAEKNTTISRGSQRIISK